MTNDVERRNLLSHSDESDSEVCVQTSVLQVKRKEENGLTRNLILAILSCVIGSSFQFGYNTGVVNAPELIIQQFYNKTYHDRSNEYLPENLLTLLWAITVAIFTVGGMLGGVTAGYWGNRYGRKGALLRNNILAVIAAVCLGISKLISSYEILIIGRFICGVNAGINTGLAPLYLSEIAPVSVRGMSGTINQLAITVGALVSQVLGLKLALGTTDLWPLCLGLTIVPVVFQLLTLSFCPESPRYLMLSQDDEQGAKRALVWLRRTQDVGDELAEMIEEKEDQEQAPKFSVMDLFRQKQLRAPLLISVVLQLSQQLSGINAVILYSTSIFTNAGLTHSEAQYSTVGTGAVNVGMTLVAALLMDRVGRRTLHLVGLGGMFCFSVLLTVSLIYQPQHHWLSYVCVIAVICYIISFATGPGAIPWFYVAELFAQGPRSAAVSIAVLVNWSANFVVSMVFPLVQKAISDYCFVPFAVLLAIFWLYTFLKVPETKGKTFEEISRAFQTPAARMKVADISVEKPLLVEGVPSIEDEPKSTGTYSVHDDTLDSLVNRPIN